MNERELNKLLKSKQEVDKKIHHYIKTEIITKHDSVKEEIEGHIQKADHNLKFIKDTLEQGYSDWAIVGCYYAIYHASLALIAQKNYYSKNHDATLTILIKEYYLEKILDIKDIEFFNQAYLDNHDILFYIETKNEREKASYSTQIVFDKKRVNDLKLKTILFVNKAKELLK